MGARPFQRAGGGSEVAEIFVARARDGTGVSGAELVETRVDRRVEVDPFSIKLRVLFEDGPTKRSPGLFAEEIAESEFVVEGGWLASSHVAKSWFVVSSETVGDGAADTLCVDKGWFVVDGSGETGRDGSGETGRDGSGETGRDGAGDMGREGGSEMGGEGGGDTGREGGSELRREVGTDTSSVRLISTCGI